MRKKDIIKLVRSYIDKSITISKSSITSIDLSVHTIKFFTGNIIKNSLQIQCAQTVNVKASTKEEYYKKIESCLKTWKKQGLITKKVYLNLSSSDVTTHRVELPKMPIKEIKEALKWIVREQISYPIEEAEYDYLLVGERKDDEDSIKLQVVYAVCERAKTIELHTLLKDSDLQLLGITISSFSLYHYLLFSDAFQHNNTTLSVLDIGSDLTQISFFKEGKLIFTRDIPLGSSHITEALTEQIITDKGQVCLTYDAAEELKIQYGIPFNEDELLLDKVEARQIYLMMRPILDLLGNEISRSLEYLSSHFGIQSDVNLLYLTGQGSKLKNIDAFIEKKANVQVSYLMIPEGKIQLPKDTDAREFFSEYSIAISTFLSHEKKVNLLPESLQIKKMFTYQKVILRTITLVLTFLIIASLINIRFQINMYKKNISILNSSWDGLKNFINKRKDIDTCKQLIHELYAGKLPVNLIFLYLSNVTPKEIELTKMNFTQDAAFLEISGMVRANAEKTQKTQKIIADYISSLSQSVLFAKINLNYVKVDEYYGESRQMFEIDCQLNKDGKNELYWDL